MLFSCTYYCLPGSISLFSLGSSTCHGARDRNPALHSREKPAIVLSQGVSSDLPESFDHEEVAEGGEAERRDVAEEENS